MRISLHGESTELYDPDAVQPRTLPPRLDRYGELVAQDHPTRCDLGDLLRANDATMRRLAVRLVGHNLVDDALQEAYLRAVDSYPRFEGRSTFQTWLFRIVHNTCVDMIRKDRRRNEIETEDGVALRLVPFDGGQSKVDVEHALAELSVEHRAAVTLVSVIGLSYDEAAGILDVARGTVATRVHRGRQQIKLALSDELA